MSRVLPKELQTKKLKSLSGDLKNIAEELIADKFGIEEEVVERKGAPNPFRDPLDDGSIRDDRWAFQRVVNPFSGSRLFRVRIGDSGHPVDGIAGAMRKMDMEGLPNRGRKIFVTKDRMNYILREARMMFDPRLRSPVIWGAQVEISPNFDEWIEQEF